MDFLYRATDQAGKLGVDKNNKIISKFEFPGQIGNFLSIETCILLLIHLQVLK